APQGQIEEALAQIWGELLNVQRVGRHDNFFDIGGYSLKAILVVNRANQSSIRITIHQIFEYPTIAGLASVAVVSDAKVDAQQSGQVPLTPIVLSHLRTWPKSLPRHISAMTFQCAKPMNVEFLEQALRHLIASHDALRLRIVQTDVGWRQLAVPVDELPLCP